MSEVVKTEGTTEGGEEKAWLTSVPEKFRGDEIFKTIDKPEDVYGRLIELNQKSQGAIRIPDDKATDEERKEFSKTINKHLGVPESIEGYEIQKPENLPEGMVYDDTLAEIMLKTLHEKGASKELAQAIFKQFNDYYIGLHGKFNDWIKEGNEKRLETLKKEWGNNFEAKNKEVFSAISKFAEAAKVPEGFGGQEGFKKWITETSLDKDPIFNWMWSKVFELVGTDSFVKGGSAAKTGGDWLKEHYAKSMPSK